MSNLRSYANLIFKTKSAGFFSMNSVANQDILSVTTHKDISSPMGNFTILLSPRVAKNLGLSRGTVYISDILKPFDLVQMQFKTNSNYKTEMIGLISRATVTLTINPADGKPIRALRIDGFDFGKVLQAFKMFFNPFVKTPSGQEFAGIFYFGKDHEIFNNPGSTSATPAQFISNFLTYCFNKVTPDGPFYPLTWPGGTSLINYVDFVSGIDTVFRDYTMSDPFILLGLGAGVETSVYDIVKAYSDPPFHEVFMDLRRAENQSDPKSIQQAESTHTINPKSSLTYGPYQNQDNFSNENILNSQQQPYVFNMRTTPFSQTNWSSVSQHRFLQTDLMHQDTAESEDNIFNYYVVVCERENFVQGNIQVAQLAWETGGNNGTPKIPIFDNKKLTFNTGVQYPPSMDTYGIRRFPISTTKYVEFIKSTDHQNNEIIKKQASLARELFRWFSFGELFESGTITLKGRVGIGFDGATIGSRLVEIDPTQKPTGKEYYIEGVLQEWNIGQPFKTTLSVSRGHFPNRTFIKDGVQYPGRFTLVQAQEINLGIDQQNNSTLFEDIPF